MIQFVFSIDLDDLVTLDSCIALSQEDNIEDLLEVSFNVSNQSLCIQEICVVSEVCFRKIFNYLLVLFSDYTGPFTRTVW